MNWEVNNLKSTLSKDCLLSDFLQFIKIEYKCKFIDYGEGEPVWPSMFYLVFPIWSKTIKKRKMKNWPCMLHCNRVNYFVESYYRWYTYGPLNCPASAVGGAGEFLASKIPLWLYLYDMTVNKKLHVNIGWYIMRCCNVRVAKFGVATLLLWKHIKEIVLGLLVVRAFYIFRPGFSARTG